MPARLLLIPLALVFALAAGVAHADGRLVQRTSKVGGFAVMLPSGWHYRNASYPSDHSTELWTDPADPKSRLDVQVSACVGCVEPASCTLHGTGCRPRPEAVVPDGTISKRKLGRWREQFTVRSPASAYLEHGVVVIRHHGRAIVDWAYVELWLPPAQATLASSILASFRFQ